MSGRRVAEPVLADDNNSDRAMRRAVALGVGVAGGIVGVLIACIAWIDIQYFGLRYDMVLHEVQEKTYSPGVYLLSPSQTFIVFPSTYQTISFADHTELRSRTSDGLEVSLEISFQYRLDPVKLYDLYMKFASKYHQIFTALAQDVLTAVATHSTAYDFFTNPTHIRDQMEQELNEIFEANAFAAVSYFQLQTVNLPHQFEQAIQATEVTKQDIKTADAEQGRAKVQFATGLMQAQRDAEVLTRQADGKAASLLLNNKAAVMSFNITQRLQIESLRGVYDALPEIDSEKALLQYMKVRAVRDHGGPLVANIGEQKAEL